MKKTAVLSLCNIIFLISLLSAEETFLNKALVLLNEGKCDQAIEVLSKGIEGNPSEPDAQLMLGMAYLEKNEYSLARNALEKAAAMKPDSVAVHYSLAMLYEKEKKYLKAVTKWEKVYQLSEDTNLKELANKHIKQLGGVK